MALLTAARECVCMSVPLKMWYIRSAVLQARVVTVFCYIAVTWVNLFPRVVGGFSPASAGPVNRKKKIV